MHQRLALDPVFHINRNEVEIGGGITKRFLIVINRMDWLCESSFD